VRRVELLREGSSARNALPYIGVAAGLAIGYLAGRNAGEAHPRRTGWLSFSISRPAAGAVLGLAGAAVGGGIGVLASHHHPDTVIYRASPRVK